jgi:hypothetical protein
METSKLVSLCSRYGLLSEPPKTRRPKFPCSKAPSIVDTIIGDIRIRRKQRGNEATLSITQEEVGLIGYYAGTTQEVYTAFNAVIKELRPLKATADFSDLTPAQFRAKVKQYRLAHPDPVIVVSV